MITSINEVFHKTLNSSSEICFVAECFIGSDCARIFPKLLQLYLSFTVHEVLSEMPVFSIQDSLLYAFNVKLNRHYTHYGELNFHVFFFNFICHEI